MIKELGPQSETTEMRSCEFFFFFSIRVRKYKDLPNIDEEYNN